MLAVKPATVPQYR